MGRRAFWLLVGIAAFAVAANTGCGNKKTRQGDKKTQVYISDQWEEMDIKSLAYIGLRATNTDGQSMEAAERIVSGQIRGNQDRFIVIGEKTIGDRAEKAGKSDVLSRIQKVWKDDQTVDQFLAKELAEAIAVDALLFAEVNDWTEYQLESTQEGTSWSRVGIGLYIYSGKSGQIAWGADQAKRKDSLPYRPTTGNEQLRQGGNAAESQRASRVENKLDSAPSPPPIDEVAAAVMMELLGELPS